MNKFNPIFNVVVTPASVSNRKDEKGNDYTLCQGASIARANGDVETRTLMVFGPAVAALKGKLRKGRKVELRVQRNGGVLKAVGLPKAA